MEIWLGVSFGLLVVGAAIVLIGVHRRREAQKLQELRRRALAKLEVTAEHKALPDDLLTNINMSSFKRQVEIQARSRLARGSLPPKFERAPAPRPRALDALFDDFELEDQSEPAPLH